MKKRTVCYFIALLTMFLPSMTFAVGNRTAQEYGDAVYRQYDFLGYNYNHAGIFSGQSGGNPRCIEAVGYTGDDTTKDNSFSGSFTAHGSDIYYGAYQPSYELSSFVSRKKIMATATQVADAYISYTVYDALVTFTSSRPVTIGNISDIRCDGIVEYCYEWNDFPSWFHTSYPSRWDISLYPEEHNDMPDVSPEPAWEQSPWAQRGAPASEGPGYSGYNPNNAFLTTPSVISLPTYELSYVRINNTAVDVTIKAKDESGIAYIGYKLPGYASWSFTPWQAQHPTSDTYSYVTRVTGAGV